MKYDVLVQWLEDQHKARPRRVTKWHRDIEANSLTEACKKALALSEGKVCPGVSMCWPVYKGKA